MTMPHERTRSLIEAEKVLISLSHDPSISETMRNRIKTVMRHYPTENEIVAQGRYEFFLRIRGHSLDITSPFLSPSTTFEGQKEFIEKHEI